MEPQRTQRIGAITKSPFTAEGAKDAEEPKKSFVCRDLRQLVPLSNGADDRIKFARESTISKHLAVQRNTKKNLKIPLRPLRPLR
ncbi:MAG: hypothetical protein DMG65_07350 [Candidatus Angelobacter sp. Gp1-AA117]|nr:MAG: hypothetical protein DMG65_07350 [Candidatus Angelobacter sp. Gp1-AA117]